MILIRGAVPGPEGSWVEIRDAVKVAAPEGVPTPAAFRKPGDISIVEGGAIVQATALTVYVWSHGVRRSHCRLSSLKITPRRNIGPITPHQSCRKQ